MEDTSVLDNQAIDNGQGQSEVTDQAVDNSQGAVSQQAEERIKFGDGEYSKSEIEAWKKSHDNYSKWQGELTQRSQHVSRMEEIVKDLKDPSISNDAKMKWLKDNFLTKEEAKAATDQMNRTGTMTPELKALMSELNEMKEWRKKQEFQQSQQAALAEREQARTLYKDRWTPKIERHVTGIWVNEGGKYADVAKQYLADLDEAIANHQKNYINGKKADIKNPALTPKGGYVPTSTDKKLSLGDGSAKASMLERLNTRVAE